MSSSKEPDGTVALNNYLQEKGRLALLSWVDESSGPRHAAEWTSQCKIDGETLASGKGPKRNLARDEAAKKALELLKEREGASEAEGGAAASPSEAAT
ncbi:hypothetical protein BD413DRAFT_114139 [Trametes elegans]|nr:hypothetical protein BD413DRAFT_114139 [Trametes elegans]